mgnify:CR=1 FL=1
MNIKGKLIEIFDTVQVTETFKKREFIIQDNKNLEYPEYIKVELIQDKVSLLDSLNIGDEINVLINIKGRKWEDKEGNIRYFRVWNGTELTSTDAASLYSTRESTTGYSGSTIYLTKFHIDTTKQYDYLIPDFALTLLRNPSKCSL